MIDDRQKEEIIARTDLADLCRALGLEPNEKGRLARCPAHKDESRPNLTIYENEKNVHCFACGFHADAFDLVAKVKGLDFKGSFDFLAARLGLPLIGDYRKSPGKSQGKPQGKGRGLGYRAGGKSPDVYPKAAPLPDLPSPTLTAKPEGLGYATQGEAATVYPNSDPPDPWRDGFSPDIIERFRANYAGLPVDSAEYYVLWDEVDRLVEKKSLTATETLWLRWLAKRVGYRVGDIAVAESGPKAIEKPWSPRVMVFDALLDLTTPASRTQAGEWLHREKGIAPQIQDAFGLSWLDDPQEAEKELRREFGEEMLLDFGILGKTKDKTTGSERTYFAFYRHRLLFPFLWRGEPVDVQGRDIDAKDKQGRFRNTGGKNPLPYNADALLEAKATAKPVFLCEGATDTLTLAQSGRLAVGIVGTGGFKVEWLPYFVGLSVYLAFDGDDAGRKAATDVSRLFLNAGHPAPKVVRLPEGVKDVNEFFRRETAK